MAEPGVGLQPAEEEGQADVSQTVAERVASALGGLSRKHRRIARHILDNLGSVAFASAQEVGVETDASAATVVRFSQTLGYKGFQHMRDEIRAELFDRRHVPHKLEGRMAAQAGSHGHLADVFASGISSIERTAVLASGERLMRAAAAIRRARHVYLVGSGLAAMLVECLAYYLQTIDIVARHVTGGEEELALALTFAGPEDAVIAISFRRHPRYAMKAIEHARAIGATSIGIANSEISPVLSEADHSFLVVTEGLLDRPSSVAAVALLDALVAAVMLVKPGEAAESQRRIDTTFKETGLLEE
ncbi:MAG TPA: MurR/RpiR family transcriptional regulator [Anaerolineae bacterium]|nr:MurR/RpiR family transcriptional regulator [Anaerolineae bacterium]